VGAELEHERLVLGDEPEEREREPPLIVEARRGLEDLPARAEDARDQLLGRGLAVGTGHGHNRNRKPRAMICGEQAERLRRVLDEHERHVGWRVIVERVDDQAGGTPASRVREECVAVEPVAPDREERLAHAERARVDRHPRHGDAEVTRDQRAPRRANDVLDGEQWHPSSYRERSRRIRRATSRSSKGSTSEPTIWYVSWPLPATTTLSGTSRGLCPLPPPYHRLRPNAAPRGSPVSGRARPHTGRGRRRPRARRR